MKNSKTMQQLMAAVKANDLDAAIEYAPILPHLDLTETETAGNTLLHVYLQHSDNEKLIALAGAARKARPNTDPLQRFAQLILVANQAGQTPFDLILEQEKFAFFGTLLVWQTAPELLKKLFHCLLKSTVSDQKPPLDFIRNTLRLLVSHFKVLPVQLA